MSKARFTYWKFTVVCAILAIVAGVSVITSRATGSPLPANTLPDVDLKSEAQTLDSFADDLGKLNKKHRELNKKDALSNAEFNSLKSDADGVKRRCSQVENAIQSIINKLKAAGRWDNFDDELLAKIPDARIQGVFRENGGPKRVFEDTASQVCSHTDEIIPPIESLRPKVKAQVQDFIFDREWRDFRPRTVRVVYNPTSPMLHRSIGCIISTIRYGVSNAARGAGSAKTDQAFTNALCDCRLDTNACKNATY